jgi:hypothetical protein
VEFVKATLSVVFLLKKRYAPYYKWIFRALSELDGLCTRYSPLEYLISSGNATTDVAQKRATVEQICTEISRSLEKEGLSSLSGNDCERHAYAVNHCISDGEIRNLHILYAI